MNVLGIDTATRTTSVALAGRERTSTPRVTDSRAPASGPERGTGHSDVLVQIDELCRELGIAAAQLDAVAIGAGPGSFTGLRIGMATAKGIAFAAQRPLWAVSSLAALAWRVRDQADVIVAVLDARRGEIYAGCFDRTLVSLVPERVMPPGELAAWAAEVSGGRTTVYAGNVAQLATPWIDATPSALGVIELALAGPRTDILVGGAPTYIRPSEAEVKYPDGVPGALRKR